MKTVLYTAILSAILFTSCKVKSDDMIDNNNPPNTIYIKNNTYSVTHFVTTPNATITWVNQDATAHTVTADDGSFNSGNIEQGGSYSKTFTTAGVYSYHCEQHLEMKGIIEIVVR